MIVVANAMPSKLGHLGIAEVISSIPTPNSENLR